MFFSFHFSLVIYVCLFFTMFSLLLLFKGTSSSLRCATCFPLDLLFLSYCVCSQIFRQSDAGFIRALNQLRLGNGSHIDVTSMFKRCSRPLVSRYDQSASPRSSSTCPSFYQGYIMSLLGFLFIFVTSKCTDGNELTVEPTVLYCTKREVSKDNTLKLNALSVMFMLLYFPHCLKLPNVRARCSHIKPETKWSRHLVYLFKRQNTSYCRIHSSARSAQRRIRSN